MQVCVDLATRPESARRLWTEVRLRAFLNSAVAVTELTPFGPRIVKHNTAGGADLLIGFQMIAESHIAVHLDRLRGLGWVDVFSCRAVDDACVIKLVACTLLPEGGVSETRCLDRGILPEGGG